ncbi:LPS export ABC transporter periplasmic protein LptC [Parvularcula maris]|uniref:LPS export ABC transporter periplasmic protein LptC n=1 Tax=Parvularcula maris TaxID=2965077 RepID=A0A9X2L9Z4_9PROT|nr:LPS export ABC transporter periplasmic protein LptC [Parvularcula maris]MCQ8185826.1 LPS export ABC transporter periplasmic protein LptC [Parvularcula maris]
MADDRETTEREFYLSARRVSRHSMRVRRLRLVTPALAVGLLLTYVLSATPPRVDHEFLAQFSGIETTEDGEGVKLSRPRYAGEDLSGRPFEVAAQSATRGQNDADPLALDRPEARRVKPDGRTSVLRAKDGTYDQTAQLVDLIGDVELEQSSSGGTFVLKTDAAKADLESQVVTSSTEVTGESERGTLRADRGTIYQNEDRVVLEGGVRMTLKPRKKGSEDKQGDGDGDS